MGGLTSRSATQQIPQDQVGMRKGNIDLLNYILGFGGKPGQAGDPTSRLQSVFGNLAPQGIQQFLNQPSPQQRAMDVAMPALQEILTPGTNNPALDRDLSIANSQGGRFGSANAILRSNALANLFNMRNQAAQTLGVLGQGAGQGQQQQAGFMDMETGRRLQLLMQLLGVSQSASFNLPFVQQPSLLDSAGQVAAIASHFVPGGGGTTDPSKMIGGK